MKLTFITTASLAFLLITQTGCDDNPEGDNTASYVAIASNNILADGFDFPISPGEMAGWIEPPEANGIWDASSYLVHREDGIHPAIDFMKDDNSSAAGHELWAIGDGIVVDIVYDREAYPARHDGLNRDEGWGNLILIQHDYEENGSQKRVWSLYAHCQTIDVEINEVVQRNQRIGLIGHTDGIIGKESWNDHLHFEIRTSNLKADAWPKSIGLITDKEVAGHFTHPLKFIRSHRPTL